LPPGGRDAAEQLRPALPAGTIDPAAVAGVGPGQGGAKRLVVEERSLRMGALPGVDPRTEGGVNAARRAGSYGEGGGWVWGRVELPDISGPVRGFTFPRGGVFFVLTPGGLVRVALDPVEARVVADPLAALYGPNSGWFVWEADPEPSAAADGGSREVWWVPRRLGQSTGGGKRHGPGRRGLLAGGRILCGRSPPACRQGSASRTPQRCSAVSFRSRRHA